MLSYLFLLFVSHYPVLIAGDIPLFTDTPQHDPNCAQRSLGRRARSFAKRSLREPGTGEARPRCLVLGMSI